MLPNPSQKTKNLKGTELEKPTDKIQSHCAIQIQQRRENQSSTRGLKSQQNSKIKRSTGTQKDLIQGHYGYQQFIVTEVGSSCFNFTCSWQRPWTKLASR
jgi:hypothetical protein